VEILSSCWNNRKQYDGSAWTTTTTMITARYLGGCGIQTAGLVFGGNTATAVILRNRRIYRSISIC
jgi:hypothetical protein